MSEKILIIDDDLKNVQRLERILQQQGYQLSAATDSQQGLDKAFEEAPDLIILDLMMPKMDGLEVINRLRQNPSTSETPILMVTAKTQRAGEEIGLEVRQNVFLAKFTRPSELRARIKTLLYSLAGDSTTDAPPPEKKKKGN